ncbi:MAG TPA: hypothetical protein VMU26_20470 [Candidatus Polarisedimenticolia bacterium]|nr:hypothetical protein [Candidatus Polarisedimenticolia bacterium]
MHKRSGLALFLALGNSGLSIDAMENANPAARSKGNYLRDKFSPPEGTPRL